MAKQAESSKVAQGAASDKTEVKVGIMDADTKEVSVPANSVIDVAVTVISLAGDKFHKDGEEFQMAKKTAEIMAERGLVKIKEEKKAK